MSNGIQIFEPKRYLNINEGMLLLYLNQNRNQQRHKIVYAETGEDYNVEKSTEPG